MKNKSTIFLALGALVVVTLLIVLVVRKPASSQSEAEAKPTNYRPQAFSTYVSSSLKSLDENETVPEETAYSGVVIFRADRLEMVESQTCYQVMEEDYTLFPAAVERVCATNDPKQLADIHLVGGVTRDEGQRYLVTLQNLTIENKEGMGMVLQVRVRDRKEDVELTKVVSKQVSE